MRLYFLRHGAAVEAEEWQGADRDRPLTEEGRREVASIGEMLSRVRLKIATIITSPLLRAKETAGIVAAALRMENRIVQDDRIANGLNLRTVHEIVEQHGAAGDLMLVGHEPSISATLGRLIGDAGIDFKKGALACVKIDGESSERGRLQWLVTPQLVSSP